MEMGICGFARLVPPGTDLKFQRNLEWKTPRRGYTPMMEKAGYRKSQGAKTPTEQNHGEIHWTAMKTILKYLRNTKDMVLVYGAKTKDELKVSCHVDAKAEYIAAAEASMKAVWIRKFIDGLGGVMPSNKRPMEMLCDNEPALAIASDPRILKGARHFQRKYHYIREHENLELCEGLPDDLPNRAKTFQDIGVIDHKISVDMAQKARVKWAIERDENSKFFHDIVNKKRRQQAIKGILVDGDEDVSNAVNEFFNSSIFLNGCNPSFIALIPKVLDAKHLSDFRLTRLIGCQYKIIGIFLANRLSLVIDELISHEQFAFIKVDFQKAFDSVRWYYLDDILGKFGIGSKWRAWIRGCLPSLKASVLVNGSPTDEFLFHRGMFVPILVGKNDLVPISYLFYAHDAMFIDIQSMAKSFSCLANNLPFTYLGVKVAGNMARINSWNEVIQKGSARKLFNLDLQKDASVAQKFQNPDFVVSFRRRPRCGIEESQFQEISLLLSSVVLSSYSDRWSWTLNGHGDFSVKSARKEIDKHLLITSSSSTRWRTWVYHFETSIP
ncbi:hypothetical protein Tco_1235725 [Tanacetum coccineum]